jgi:serine/threonine protein kinase/serine phosphatase RsbU (regulator of sigma subunit)/tetratricopeptide (TPR) repeat protein
MNHALKTSERFIVENYRVLELLSESPTSQIFRGCSLADPLLQVAIKISKNKIDALHPAARVHFESEAEYLSRLSHPGIVKLLRFGFFEDRPYLIMEYIPGETLAFHGLNFTQIADVLKQIAQALAHSHSKGILHRDLKPTNILLFSRDSQLQVKLLDFGLSSAMGNDPTSQTLKGTLLYMAPELFGSRQAIDQRVDFYSLGMIAVELLNGAHPFAGREPADVVQAQLNISPTISVELPTALHRVIERLLAKDPFQRYQTARGLAYDLQTLQDRLHRGLTGPFELRTQDQVQSLSQPKFLGQSMERQTLQQALERASHGKLQTTLIQSQPGLGKSRLISEVTRKWSKGYVLSSAGHGYGETLAYGMVIQLLRDLAQQRFSPAMLEQIKISLADLSPDLVSLVPELKSLLGVRNLRLALDPDIKQRRFTSRLIDAFLTIAHQSPPLTLIFEDIQWADPASLRFIIELSKRAKASPLCLILSCREDQVSADLQRFFAEFGSAGTVKKLSLKPMSDSQIGALIYSMLGQQIPEVADFVARQADGTPQLAVELLHAMVESEALILDEKGWRVTDLNKSHGEVLNDTLARNAVPQMEKMPSEALLVLRLASVLGRSFRFPELFSALHAFSAAPRETCARWVMDALREAEDARLIRRLSDVEGYSFRHEKIRETLYQGVSAAERSVFHRIIAKALEQTLVLDPEVIYTIANHYSRSDDTLNAMLYSIKAGDCASQHHANFEAINFYRAAQANSCFNQLPEVQRFQLIESLADSESFAGDMEQALSHYRQLFSDFKKPEDHARILGKIGHTLLGQGEIRPATEALEQALRLNGITMPQSRRGAYWQIFRELSTQLFYRYFARTAAPPPEAREQETAHLMSLLCHAYYAFDPIRAVGILLQHANFCKSRALTGELAQTFANQALALMLIPWPRRALRYAKRSLAVHLKTGDRRASANSRYVLSSVYAGIGRWTEALQHGLIAESELRRLADRWIIPHLQFNLAHLFIACGQWDEAEDYATRLFEVAEERKYTPGIAYALWLRSSLGARLDNQQLLHQIEHHQRYSLKSGDLHSTALLLIAKGRALGWLERHSEACATFELANDILSTSIFHGTPFFSLPLEFAEALFRLAHTCADQELKRGLYFRAAQFARQAQWRCSRHAFFQASVLRVQAMSEWHMGQKSRAENLWRRALLCASKQYNKYQMALTLRDWAEALKSEDQARSCSFYSQALYILKELKGENEWRKIAELLPDHLKSAPHLQNDGSVQARDGLPSPERRELDSLLHLGLGTARTSTDRVDQILAQIKKILRADRACLIAVNERTGQFETLVETRDSRKPLQQSQAFSQTLILKALQEMRPVSFYGDDVGPLATSASLEFLNIKSVIAIPLQLHATRRVVLYLDSDHLLPHFSEMESQVLTVVGNHLAVLMQSSHIAQLESERLEMSRDIELTSVVQKLFLPSISARQSANWEFAVYTDHNQKCRGDWWWFTEGTTQDLELVLGDVSGQGAAPAMITASITSLFHIFRQPVRALNETLELVSRTLAKIVRGEFLSTAIAIHLQKDQLQVWCAATSSIYLLGENGDTECLARPGSHLGAQQLQLGYHSRTLQKGDRLLLLTDNLAGRRSDQGRPLGERRLLRAAQNQRSAPLPLALKSLIESLTQMQGKAHAPENFTAILIEVR